MTPRPSEVCALDATMTSVRPIPAAILSIERAPDPSPATEKIRSLPRKERSVRIRAVLKRLGIVGVSATTPSYSMASSTHITLPRIEHSAATDWNTHERSRCPLCQREQRAMRRLETLVRSSFLDLDNRSDFHTDYFDDPLYFTFS